MRVLAVLPLFLVILILEPQGHAWASAESLRRVLLLDRRPIALLEQVVRLELGERGLLLTGLSIHAHALITKLETHQKDQKS